METAKSIEHKCKSRKSRRKSQRAAKRIIGQIFHHKRRQLNKEICSNIVYNQTISNDDSNTPSTSGIHHSDHVLASSSESSSDSDEERNPFIEPIIGSILENTAGTDDIAEAIHSVHDESDIDSDPVFESSSASENTTYDFSETTCSFHEESDSDSDGESDHLLNEYASNLDNPSDTVLVTENDTHKSEETKVHKLASWAIATNQTRKSVKQLLQILREDEPHLPKDRRTLCKTPKTAIIHDMDSGQYLHIGIKTCLLQFFKSQQHVIQTHPIETDVFIDINIDGVPLAKKSSGVLWPILLNVVGFNFVLLVGVYYGQSKPKSINEYLEKFVAEFLELQTTGLSISSKLYKIHIRSIVADAPARAFLLNIPTFSGYNSCNKCKISGTYILHRITFPFDASEKRTDEEFRNKTFPDHHVLPTAVEIEKLPIDCVKSIPIDYMHAALLGVTLQLLSQWIVIRRKSYSLDKQCIEHLSNNIISIRLKLPSEFSRTPRPLQYLRRYKATELRQLLLYTLPIILQNLISNEVYNHFLKFHCAIRILCSKDLCLSHNELAAFFLEMFVNEFDEIYDDHQISFNVHSLLHLSNDVEYYQKPLDDFSSFKFENFLQFLKKLAVNGTRPLQQIYYRYFEKISFDQNVSFSKQTLPNKKSKDGGFNFIYFNDYKFSISSPNNVCYNVTNKCFYKIDRIVSSNDSFKFFGKPLLYSEPIYLEPIDSRELGMYKCKDILFGSTEIIQMNSDIRKVASFDFKNEFFFLVLIH